MKFDILTLFPDTVYNYSGESIMRIAQEKNLIKITAHNFRDYSKDKHRRVDDAPYGGGAGMVLSPQPIYSCLEKMGLARNGKKVKKPNTKIIIMDPDGKKFDQKMAEKFSKLDRLVLVCGRYQGFDERIYKLVDERISIGDFVLSGGELPALSIVEATARLIPGVLGNQESLNNETHSLKENVEKANKNKDKTEVPLYTRPEDFMGQKVPKILLSGDHKKIEEWRLKHCG